ncbi:MAG TPA: M56 family metallopeptidase, partial [Longimicrobiales bacterium]
MMNLLLESALKGTVVLLAASLLVITMRRGSAASRHLIWQLALLALLALPLIKVVSPLQFAVLPTLRSPIAAPIEQAPQVTQPVQRTEMKQTERSATGDVASTSAPVSTSTSTSTSTFNSQATPAQAAGPSLLIRALFWAAVAWLAVAAVLLLRLAFGFLLVRWFALRAYPLYEDGWNEMNGELAHMIGLKDPVRLLGSPHIATPMTWGRTVMLPSAAEDWTEERRRVVLLHELAHIRRKDTLTHMFAQLACAVYWFHPLVWKAAARMRAEAERACDDLVLRAGTRASVYADHLLELIRTIGGMRTPAVALPMAQRSTFEGRLLAILEPHQDRSAPKPVAVAGMVLVLGLVVLPLAGLTSDTQLNATVMNGELLDDETQSRSKQMDKLSTLQKTDEKAVGQDADYQATTDLDQLMGEMAASAVSTIGENVGVSKLVDGIINDVANMAANAVTGKSSQQVSESAVQSLISALNDADAEVRFSAIQSLGALEDERAIAALSKALREDTDARVRKMAAWALGNIEDVRALPALTHALKNDRDIEVRRTAVWAMGQIEDRAAVPALTDAMRDSDAEVRAMTIWALGQIEDRSAVPALGQALRSDDVAVRRQAAWALGQIEDASAVPALATALRDSDAEVRSTVVWALGQIESPNAVEPLSGLLNDANADVRKQAAWAMGQIEAASAVPALSRLAREDR